MFSPFTSAWMLGPSGWRQGKISDVSNIRDSRADKLLICGRYTSACSRNVVVSDQLRTATLMFRPPCEKARQSPPRERHGPAMQETRHSETTLPSPARSSFRGDGCFPFAIGGTRRTLIARHVPLLEISKVLASVPIFLLSGGHGCIADEDVSDRRLTAIGRNVGLL